MTETPDTATATARPTATRMETPLNHYRRTYRKYVRFLQIAGMTKRDLPYREYLETCNH